MVDYEWEDRMMIPHIFMKNGYWRVSKKPKRACRVQKYSKRWDAAYNHIRKLNEALRNG